MTVHDLHDALTLLPSDLVTATDKLRNSAGRKVIQWRRWLSLAACLVLVLSVTLVFGRGILPGMGGSSKDAVTQAPAAAAPMENGKLTPTEAPAAAEPAAPQEAPAADSALSGITEENAAEEELYIDHSHQFAQARTEDRPAVGYCGNMLTTVYLDEMNFTLAGGDSVTLTDMLINLDYDPDEVCRCAAEFTVDTEMLTGIEVNLTEGFARCEKGQAALTEAQAKTIQEIIDKLQ